MGESGPFLLFGILTFVEYSVLGGALCANVCMLLLFCGNFPLINQKQIIIIGQFGVFTVNHMPTYSLPYP